MNSFGGKNFILLLSGIEIVLKTCTYIFALEINFIPCQTFYTILRTRKFSLNHQLRNSGVDPRSTNNIVSTCVNKILAKFSTMRLNLFEMGTNVFSILVIQFEKCIFWKLARIK